MLGLLFKQDNCIFSPQIVCFYVKQSRSSFDFLLRGGYTNKQTNKQTNSNINTNKKNGGKMAEI